VSRDFRSAGDLDIDADRIETVSREGSDIASAVRWVCKSRHWQRPYYQVLVIRNNGWYIVIVIIIIIIIIISARCNIYISRLCYDVSVRLSVCDGSELAHYS